MSLKMPKLAGIFAFVAIASLGLPGLAGFWGEVLSLLSAYQPAPGLSVGLFRTLMVFGALGTVLTAGYFLWTLQRVNQGPVPEAWEKKEFKDVLAAEWTAWVPLLIAILVLGLFPRLLLGITDGPVQHLYSIFQ